MWRPSMWRRRRRRREAPCWRGITSGTFLTGMSMRGISRTTGNGRRNWRRSRRNSSGLRRGSQSWNWEIWSGSAVRSAFLWAAWTRWWISIATESGRTPGPMRDCGKNWGRESVFWRSGWRDSLRPFGGYWTLSNGRPPVWAACSTLLTRNRGESCFLQGPPGRERQRRQRRWRSFCSGTRADASGSIWASMRRSIPTRDFSARLPVMWAMRRADSWPMRCGRIPFPFCSSMRSRKPTVPFSTSFCRSWRTGGWRTAREGPCIFPRQWSFLQAISASTAERQTETECCRLGRRRTMRGWRRRCGQQSPIILNQNLDVPNC